MNVTGEHEANATTPPTGGGGERRDIEAWEWRRIYRGMRAVRARSLRWLHRAAGVDYTRFVASPRELATKLVTAVYFDEESLQLAEGLGEVMMTIRMGGVRDFDDRFVYALHVPPGTNPESHTLAWALACLGIYVLDGGTARKYDFITSEGQKLPDSAKWRSGLRMVRRIDDMRSRTFDERTRWLFFAFRRDGWFMLQRFIAAALVDDFDRSAPEGDYARDLLRERLRRFKRAKRLGRNANVSSQERAA